MISYPALQDELLLHSRQLYYVVTDRVGTIIKTNKTASQLSPALFTSKEILATLKTLNEQKAIATIDSITFFKSIRWDVNAVSADCYQWVAPVENEKEEWQKLFHKNPLPSWIVDKQTCSIVSANAAAIKAYGFSLHELVHQDFCNFLAARLENGEKEIKTQSLVAEQKVITRQVKKGGDKIWVELHCSCFYYKETEVFLLCAVDVTEKINTQNELLTEITERKKIGDSQRQLANLVEQTADVLTAANLDFIPTTWNKAAEEIYGLPAEKIIGHDIREFIDVQYNGLTQADVRNELNKKGVWRGEMSFIRPTDQRLITLLINFKLLKDEANNPLGYVIAGTNITERKEAELKWKESEKRFHEVADSAPVGIWMTDNKGKLSYVNKQLLSMSGLHYEDYEKLSWKELLHPEDAAACLEKYDHHFKNRLPVTLVYRLKASENEYRWVQDSGIPRVLENGTFMGYIGSVVDIHDTKAQEDQLQYQAMVLNNVSDIIISTDLDFKVRSWNKIAVEYFELTEEEAKGKPFISLVQFDFSPITRQKAMEILAEEGRWQGEVSFINNQQEVKYLLHTISNVQDAQGVIIGYMAVSRDITARKEAEEKMRQSEHFYRNLIADSLDGMLLSDAAGTITFVSPSVTHVLNYDAADILGKNIFEFVHQDDISWAMESFEREVTENPEIKSVVVRLRHKSGEWIWCMVRGHNLLHNPHIKSIAIYFHDDSLRKKASDALKQSEQRFRTLVRDIQVGVMMQNAEGNVIMCNQSFTEILRLPEEKIIGNKVWEIFPDVITEDGKRLDHVDKPSFKAIKTKTAVTSVMGVLLPCSTKRVWLIFNADPILDEDNNVINVVCSLTDITERKELEQKLVQEKINGQKLLTQATIDGQEKERREIGKELHDNIGQQLTTIKLYLDLAKSSANESALEMIMLSQRSVSDVINEIRRMSRSLMPPTLGDLGLIDSINDVIESIKRTQRVNVELDYFEFDEDLLPENGKLMVFRIVQEQMNNIIKHANATKVTIILRHTSKLLVFEIKDNGCGFEIKKIRKGLGLTNMKNRAELFGGKMEILSAPGQGCTLKIMVPNILQPLYQ